MFLLKLFGFGASIAVVSKRGKSAACKESRKQMFSRRKKAQRYARRITRRYA
jgi:hypothetical protein